MYGVQSLIKTSGRQRPVKWGVNSHDIVPSGFMLEASWRGPTCIMRALCSYLQRIERRSQYSNDVCSTGHVRAGLTGISVFRIEPGGSSCNFLSFF